MKIVYADNECIISLHPWPDDTNVICPGYHRGIWEAHYPVPALSIEVDWTDAELGYLDLWIGHYPCQHIELVKPY